MFHLLHLNGVLIYFNVISTGNHPLKSIILYSLVFSNNWRKKIKSVIRGGNAAAPNTSAYLSYIIYLTVDPFKEKNWNCLNYYSLFFTFWDVARILALLYVYYMYIFFQSIIYISTRNPTILLRHSSVIYFLWTFPIF